MYYEDELPRAEPKTEADRPTPTKITICYFLIATYASSIGGCGTLIGSATNLSLQSMYVDMYPNAPDLDFPTFMAYTAPVMLIQTVLLWLWMQFLYMGMFRPGSDDAKACRMDREDEAIARQAIQTKYAELGPMSSHEKSVAVLFALALALWFFRKPGFVTGWAELLTDFSVGDSTPGLLIIVLMFVVPAKWSWLDWFVGDQKSEPTKASEALITWPYLNKTVPWDLIFLLGGGFALAEAGKVSGMSAMIGNAMGALKPLSPILILFAVCLTCSVLTQFTSNVAVANIVLPVVAEMAVAIEMHPLYLMLPAGLFCSYAFHLPVGTPPNAIAAGLANIPTKQMVKAWGWN